MKTKSALALLTLLVLAADGAVVFNGLVRSKGTSFDFYLVWVGAREFWHGSNPYTDQVATQIQIGMLGHAAAPTENQYYFVYPAYVSLLVFPFVLLPFDWAVTSWLVLQQILLAIMLYLILDTLDWKPSFLGVLALILAWVMFRYIWVAMVLAQTSVLVLFLLVAAAYASRHGHEGWAAIALATATIKPQLAVLPISAWLVTKVAQQQLRAAITFCIAWLVLFVSPFLLVGNWVEGLLRTVTLYTGYNRASSPLTLLASLLPDGAAWGIVVAGAAVAVGYLLWVAWHRKNETTILGLSVLSTLMLVPLPSVYDISLILVPWLMCCRAVASKRDQSARALLVLLAAMPFLSWTVITILPEIFDRLRLPFDVIVADKFLIPALLLAVFVYGERKRLWLWER